MNRKAKGTRAEHKSIARYEAAGYSCMRSAASLSPWDFFACREDDAVLVQVKSNRPPRPAERQTLAAFKAPEAVRRVVEIWHDYARVPVVVDVRTWA